MSGETKIEEIESLTTAIYELNHKRSVLDYFWIATELHKLGYRKESEVAREIFSEIERAAMSKINENLSIAVLDDTYYIQAIDELKKKYLEEG